MSRRYIGGVISATAPVPTGPYQCGTAKGIWTLPQQLQSTAAGTWPTAGNAAPSSQSYTTAGTYTWVAPAGVTSVSVVAVGGGGGGRKGFFCGCYGGPGGSGAGLGYKNNYSVTPGNSYVVSVGNGGASCSNGIQSYFNTCAVVAGKGGGTPPSFNTLGAVGTYIGDGGGNGKSGTLYNNRYGGGGGGSGGYSGSTGGGGTGASSSGGGGGTGIFGQGSSGVCRSGCTNGVGGGGGSSGTNGGTGAVGNPGIGGSYGGGGGGAYFTYSTAAAGSCGAVRLMWPGNTRSFPSTGAGSP